MILSALAVEFWEEVGPRSGLCLARRWVNVMDLPGVWGYISQVLTDVTIYPLIAIEFLLIGLVMTLNEWRRGESMECRRLSAVFGLILVLRIAYLAANGNVVFPVLKPFIECVSLILVFWAFTRSLFNIPEQADALRTLLLVLALAGAMITLALWLHGGRQTTWYAYTGPGAMLLWHLPQVGLAGLGTWLVLWRRSEQRGILTFVFSLFALGNIAGLFGYGAIMDPLNAVIYPLLAVATYQMITSDLRSFGEELRSVSEQSLSHTKERVFLLEISRAASKSFELSTLLEVIAQYSGLAFDADRVTLMLFDDRTAGRLQVAARYQPLSFGEAESEQTHFYVNHSPLLSQAIEQQRQFRFDDGELGLGSEQDTQTLQALLGLEAMGPLLVQPLILNAQTIGLAVAVRSHGRPAFTDEESRLFEAMASLVSAALEHSHLYQELKETNEELVRLNQDLQAAYQHLRDLDRLKSSFIGLITHELRSPFVGLDLSLQLMRRHGTGNLADAQQEILAQLEQGLQQARRMVDSLVSFASLLSKQGPLHFEQVDFAALVQQVVTILEPMAQSRNVECHIEAGTMPVIVEADAERLGEAVHHLVHNAIKFNRAGGRVDIRYWADQTHLALEIEDTGMGIPASQLETIWEQFTQRADPLRRGVEGLGLGLALVKLVVDAHHGETAVQSIEGVGSIFGFRIPLRQPAATPDSLSAEKRSVIGSDTSA